MLTKTGEAQWAPFRGFGLITKLNRLLLDAEDLEARAETGDAVAMLECAEREFYGIGRHCSFETAATWFQKAAAQGDPRGMGGLAECYLYGCGISPDFTRARKWFQRAADGGDSYSRAVIDNDCDVTETKSYLEYHWKNRQ